MAAPEGPATRFGVDDVSGYAVRVGAGAVAGLGAWVVGFVLTVVLTFVLGVDASGGDDGSTEADNGAALLGLVFLGAHLVDTELTPVLTEGFNFVTQLAETVDPAYWVLFAVPPLTLSVAGAAVAARDGTALSGPLVAAGYLPACLVGLAVFRVELSSAGSTVGVVLSAATTPTVVVAGTAYPLLFGLVGGTLGRLVLRTRDREDA